MEKTLVILLRYDAAVQRPRAAVAERHWKRSAFLGAVLLSISGPAAISAQPTQKALPALDFGGLPRVGGGRDGGESLE
jgi:hypothetical protein